jgi:hypothetical protein
LVPDGSDVTSKIFSRLFTLRWIFFAAISQNEIFLFSISDLGWKTCATAAG